MSSTETHLRHLVKKQEHSKYVCGLIPIKKKTVWATILDVDIA